MNPVCVKCGKSMKAEKNVFIVEQLDALGNGYKKWSTDKYKCERCGIEVVVGFGQAPMSEHFEADYESIKSELQFD